MIIQNIGNPVWQSYIFFGILALAAIVSVCLKKKEDSGFPPSTTNELKGWATILVVTSHIGYFLFANHQFLYPLSNIAGVGVDLFLFLSGFGLVASFYKKPLTTWDFYKKRLLKIFIPLWIILIAFLLLDKFLLNQTYQLRTVIESFFGIFRHADIYQDINSPLWYLTLILFYYLTFPFVFMRERPGISALLWLLAGYYFTNANFGYFAGVNHLHAWHIAAFPLGVFFAGLVNNPSMRLKKISEWSQNVRLRTPSIVRWILRILAIVALLLAISYWTIHPGVGGNKWVVQTISLITLVEISLVVWLKPIRFRLLEWLGVYSYEIYLLHWPLLYRYDFILSRLPAGVAVAVGFIWIFGVSMLLRYLSNLIGKISFKPRS